ncbi:NlpC/P60 family protein [Ochrobactrum sp. BD67]
MTIAEEVLSEAERWIGTPYRHGASTLGVSCDCLGLVRGVWRSLYGCEPEAPGVYAPDWAEVSTGDPMLEAASRHMIRRDSSVPMPGDLVVFRWRAGVAAKHLGIMAQDNRFIHAYQGHSVMASALVPQWRNRIAGIFIFPERKI